MKPGYDGSIRIDTSIDSQGFNQGITGITKSLTKLGKVVAASQIAKVVIDVGKASINIASDLKEVQNVVDTAFGDMTYMVEDFADTAIDKFGLSELAAKKTASTYMAMNRGMGITGKTAAQMAINVAGLTGDVASFYNVSQDVADTALKSIWTGETESLKQFGVVMTQVNLQQFAYSQGINKKISAMNQAEQVMLRYQYVTQQLGLAQGDFAKTSGSWANQTRILSERWKELLGILGTGLMEVLLPVVKFLNTVLEILIKIFSKIGDIYNALTGKKLVKSNNAVADSASYAADSEYGLADSVEAAGKEIKKQLARFDELNILQKDIASGGDGIGLNPDNLNFGDLNVVDNSGEFKGLKNEFEDFFFGIENRYRGLRQELLIPIRIPAPFIEPIANPVWSPNYGLDGVPALIPAPEFQPIPNPVWVPNWNIYDSLYKEGELSNQYVFSWGVRLQEGLAIVKERLTTTAGELAFNIQSKFIGFQEATQTTTSLWGTQITEFMRLTGESISTNTQTLAENVSLNFENWRINTSQSVENWKKDVSRFVYTASNNMLTNVNAFLQSSSTNIANWAKASGEALVTWGNGVVDIAHETAVNFVTAIVDGLKSAWEKLKEYSKATGQSLVSGSFNGKFAIPSLGAIALGIIGTIGAGLSLTRGGFVPALATGAVIPPNNEFLAILGDQKQGRNIETPERLLREIMKEELSDLGGNGNMTIIVQIGDETITERVVNNINRQSRISGKTVINV